MKKFVLILMLIFVSALSVQAEPGIELVPTVKRSGLLIERDFPAVYKPTRLIIGQETKFTIKAKPGSYVSIAVSPENTGSSDFYGKQLRLGKDMNTVEGIIPENGVLELGVITPEDKKLEGKKYYFEVAVWKTRDLSDIKIAQIFAPNGQQTNDNSIELSMPPKDVSLPGLAPAIPGTSANFGNAIEAIENMKKDKNKYKGSGRDMEQENYYNTPLMLRNLYTPDVKR